MKFKMLKRFFLLSILAGILFASCDKPDQEPQLGHALRVVVYYKCDNPSTNRVYLGAPSKSGYDIYYQVFKLNNGDLTEEILEQMNTFVKSCGIENFSEQWFSDSDLTKPLTTGPLTSKWEDNNYNYLAFTQIEEDLTPRFTEWIVRDSSFSYRFNSSNFDIFPIDTSNVNFSDELQRRSYIPYTVAKVYYINPQTNLVDKEWQAGQPLQGKKIFVDLNSTWSNQRYIKFVNSVQRTSPNREPNYLCNSITGSKKISDFYPNIFNNPYEYLKIYKGEFLQNGDIKWNKNKVYSADDTLNPYELIRIDTCIPKLNIYMIDSNGNTQDFTAQYDIAYTFTEDYDYDYDFIKNYDLGEIGNQVNEKRSIVHVENSSWIPKAYYKVKSDETEGLPAEEVLTPKSASGYSYIQITDGCKTDKLKNEIYVLVEGTVTPDTNPQGNQGTDSPEQDNTETTLTERIAAAQDSIDFESIEIAEDAEVSTAITIKNLKLGGKTLTIKASGTQLQNVSNAVIIIDQQVGDGDVTLAGCSNITKLVVNGGGSNSIHIKNSKVASVEVKKDAVRVAVEGTSEVETIVVNAANTKIESEENIVIKAITVNENVDKVTVKGGTVEKIEVVAFDEDGTPTDAPSESQGESQTGAKIIVDGKTDVQSVVGTTEVTLTEDAKENGATVVIAEKKEVTPPTASFEGSTITFNNNGSVEGTDFENEKYYFEYIFDMESDNLEMQALEYKIKLYKLKNSIELYYYTPIENPQNPGKHAYKYSESDTNSITFDRLYDTTLNLLSAGLVKGDFSEERPNNSTVSYDKQFNISNCGMPAKLVMPDDPRKPVVTVTPTDKGNKITVSNSTLYYKSIEIVAAEKDENNEWKPTKTKLFAFEDMNNPNPSASTSMEFIDSYVNAGKEYAYYIDTNEYMSTNRYEYSTKNPYIAVTATGGKGEIVIQAEATDQGIKITVPEIETTDKFSFFDTLLRGNYNSDYTSINNLNKLKGEPVIDYFVNAGKEYTYTLESHFYYHDEKYNYYPHSNICKITATGGLGEAVITNSPAAVQNGQAVNFTTPPVLGISPFPKGFKASIKFMYKISTDENSSTSKTFEIDYAPGAAEVTGDISEWFNQEPKGTWNTNNSYEVYIKYPYESDDPLDTTGITYQNFIHNTNFSGMPSSITITQE